MRIYKPSGNSLTDDMSDNAEMNGQAGTKPANPSSRHEWLKTTMAFLISTVVMLTILHFIRFPEIDGESMQPTYQDGQRVVVLYTKNVSRGDVAIVWCDQLDEYIVKRVIGVSGDRICISNGHLYVNDKLVFEPYINDQNWVSDDFYLLTNVTEDQLFLMGDNRCHSNDSRVFGTFPKNNVFGKAIQGNQLPVDVSSD